MPATPTARGQAVQFLGQVLGQGRLLSEAMSGAAWDSLAPAERAAAQRLAQEVLRNLDRCDALLKPHLRKAPPLGKVHYDAKLKTLSQALGMHTRQTRVHGSKLRSHNSVRIASQFKAAPEAFLRMIVVHELAHFKETEHNKAFYQLCSHMAPDYHQLELDTRLWLLWQDTANS